MLRSIWLVVGARSLDRVVRRASQLALSRDATVTIVEPRSWWSRGDRLSGDSARDLVPFAVRGRWISMPSFELTSFFEQARSQDVELVVMGDAGRWGWRAAALMGHVPVLIVRSTGEPAYHRPLVALDSAARARTILDTTREVFRADPPPMSAVHVHTEAAPDPTAQVSESLSAAGAFGDGWTRYLGHGDPRSFITQTARDIKADLVVVGCRPRFTASRLLFGSVSCDVMRKLDCDVLAIPAPQRSHHAALAEA